MCSSGRRRRGRASRPRSRRRASSRNSGSSIDYSVLRSGLIRPAPFIQPSERIKLVRMDKRSIEAETKMFTASEGYERFMGRWSRLLAPQYIAFAGIRNGERVLDVGTG